MNVIQFFQQVSTEWNEEQKCNSCWTFGAPLSISGMSGSTQENDSVCCNHLFITEYEISNGYKKNDLTQQINTEWCDHIFTLFVVKKADLGINVYNEQTGHPIDESLWKTILEPLLNCLGCGKEFDLCEMGYEFEIFKWNMKATIYKEDQNYTGWRILGIFRQYI